MQTVIRPTLKILYWMLILSAVMIGVLRLSIPQVQYFKSDIETLLRQSVLPGLSFSNVELEWKQFDHLIHVRNATLTIPNHIESIVVEQLSFEISLWRSLLAQSLVIHEVNAVVESLTIRKDQNKHWWLSDISLSDLILPDKSIQSSEHGLLEFDVSQIIGLTPNIIHIEIDHITIDDEHGGQQHKIERTVFEMQRRQGVVRATFNTNLQSLGGQLSAKGIFSKHKGLLYSEINKLNVSPQLASLFDIEIAGLQQARLTNANFWLSLDAEKSPVIQTNFSIDNGQYQVADAANSLPFSFDTRLSIQKLKQDWRMIGQLDQLVLNGKKVPGIETQLNLTQIENKTNLSGWVKSLDLSILTALDNKTLPDSIAKKVVSSELSGDLDNIWFNLDPTNVKNLSLTTQINHLTINPVLGIPGFNDLAASLVIGNQNLKLKSIGKQIALDFADSFRAPIELDRYSLEANASLDKAGVRLSISKFEASNSDISLAGRLRLDFDQADTPFMYLRASFDQGNAASKSKYLPVKLLPESVLAWLDDGIKDGEVSEGNLLYHGRLKSIRTLDKEQSGGLYVDFKVNNSTLMFSPAWDTVLNAKSIITFHNLGFLADISSASFGDLDGVYGQVSIADLSKLTINLNLHANTETSKALPTWLAMPISTRFRKVASNFKNASGQVQIKTNLIIPLAKTSSSTVRVDLAFKNAGVDTPAWDVALRQVNGDLFITQDQVLGKDIKAHYFDDPITININTDQTNSKTLIQADGLINTPQLMRLLPTTMSKGVTGKSDWQVQLAIDNKQTDDREPVLQIKGQSNLKNTKIELPAPLSKSAEVAKKISVAIGIYTNNLIDFDVHYGSNILVQGYLESIDGTAKYQLKSMDVGLSTSLRAYNLNRGVRLYGTLPTLSVDDWSEWYQADIVQNNAGQNDNSDKTGSGESAWNLITFVDVQLQSAIIERRQWTDVSFFLSQEENEFLVDIKSSHLTGQLTLPKHQSPENPTIANLEHLKFESSELTGPTSSLLPNDFYNLSLISKTATYDDYEVENLQLETRLDGNKLVIQKIDFQRDTVFLRGQGLWEYEPTNNTNLTSFDFTLKGSKFGQTMAAFGLGDAIGGGEIDLDSHLAWSNSLLNFNWDSLTGDVKFILKDGVLNDVDPGSARLIGLLSLNALPRRLLFGFSDVVANGLEFDQIAGSYTIAGENLIINNTKMDSPSAKVLVTGSTGLRSKVYDQKMFITPKVRQALPVIGSIVAGSGVGWGMLLLQKIFKTAIDKTVEIEYTIKGTWDNPKITLIKKPIIEQEIIGREK
ncbi:MAG: hypothetical protein ACI9YO_001383 [Gammaproteobacteria bacterium]|jgi:uncharacterized protein (TIGR02099 family)